LRRHGIPGIPRILPEDMATRARRHEVATFLLQEYSGRPYGPYDCVRRDSNGKLIVQTMRQAANASGREQQQEEKQISSHDDEDVHAIDT